MRASTHDPVSVQPAAWSGFGRDLRIPRKLGEVLELHARLLHPDAPDDALASREAFERLASEAVLEASGRLRTRFATVASLVDALESLGFAAESEAPSPVPARPARTRIGEGMGPA